MIVEKLIPSVILEREERISQTLFGRLSEAIIERTSYRNKFVGSRIGGTAGTYLSVTFFRVVFLFLLSALTVQTTSISFSFARDVVDYLEQSEVDKALNIRPELIVAIKEFLRESAQLFSSAPFPSPPAPVIGLCVGSLYLLYRLYRPIYVRNERAREIDNQMTRLLSHMHALSEGGLPSIEIIRLIGESESLYGAASEEMGRVSRIAERSDESLVEALEHVADTTPNDKMKELFEEYTRVLTTGADETTFLRGEAERALEVAREREEEFISQIELAAEAYIVGLILVPLVYLILQVAVGVRGGVNEGLLQSVVYIFIPLGTLAAILVIYILGRASSPDWTPLDIPNDYQDFSTIEEDLDGTIYIPYNIREKLTVFRDAYSKTGEALSNNPSYSLFLTGPTALVYALGVFQTQQLPANIGKNFFVPTVTLAYLPLMIMVVPTMLLYEYEARRKARLRRVLPGLMSNIAEANEQGLTINKSLEVTADSGSGILYKELRRTVRQGIATNNLSGALLRFSNKMHEERLSSSMIVLTQASRASSNVHRSIQIIADRLEDRLSIDRKRLYSTYQYIAIVTMGFALALLLVYVMDELFLATLKEQLSSASEGPSTSFFFFKRIFFHTLLVLGFNSGIFAGYMRRNSPLEGLKFSVAMTTVSVIFSYLFLTT